MGLLPEGPTGPILYDLSSFVAHQATNDWRARGGVHTAPSGGGVGVGGGGE